MEADRLMKTIKMRSIILLPSEITESPAGVKVGVGKKQVIRTEI